MTTANRIAGIESLRRFLPGWKTTSNGTSHVLGLLPGEGVGPELTTVAEDVLRAAAAVHNLKFDIRTGGEIGGQAFAKVGRVLPPDVRIFCSSVLESGGAILCGPGGGRFVYELRATFDLFCKIIPIRPFAALSHAAIVKPDVREDVDIVVVREIAGGEYLGDWGERKKTGESVHVREAFHTMCYSAPEVERLLRIACGLAMTRRRKLTLVLKPGGFPSISRLWHDTLSDLKVEYPDLETNIVEVDYMAYRMVSNPREFDVVAAPNLFGDIIADLGGVLLGSRGMCSSGNFGVDGKSAYNTGHGAAFDIAGKDVVNPLAHLECLTLALRITYGLHDLARTIEDAIQHTLKDGIRTRDIPVPGGTIVGTKEMSKAIIERCQARSSAAKQGSGSKETSS